MTKRTISKDKIRETARQAWRKMAQLAIQPSPRNFRVWYSYYAAYNPDLSKAIERLLEAGENFSPEQNDALYKIACQGETDADFLAEIHKVTGEIIAGIATATLSNQDFQKNLSGVGESLNEIKDIHQLRDLINNLTKGSKEMESSTAFLQARLDQATADIKELQSQLEETEKIANTDSLTGIYNRHAFENKLAEICSGRGNQSAALIMIDIDHFKKFNDAYGHRIGDTVLRGVAQVFAECIPLEAFPARYGGEEFAIILPDLDLSQAREVAETLRQIIARRELRRGRDGARLGKITVSLGVAVIRPGDDGEGLVERADEALYRAKGNGRNRVETI